ncbi:Lpg1974 family pore-forming outer membrane protein [Legionella yabuuchiae]|uniref:Lpg1974 family pore-forming outer membrane protein n=1 Tax=Legionella yabuuchiae TaxID=376727 RepID=UPI00105540E3|nr:Lpg1974 family pore-forming outer membrane protein [Legionella yabuuchiae]
MRYFYHSIIGISLLFSSLSYAVDFYADVLYWQAFETVDWSLTNSLSLPNQVISYNTIDFDFAPGVRVGTGFQHKNWYGRLLYTHYHVNEKATTQGNVISAFIPGKFAEAFYNTGHVNFTIDFNMIDADLFKKIEVGESFILQPIIGIKGGSINQQVNTRFQGDITVYEKVSNNFGGVGPKVGIDSQWIFYKKQNLHSSLVAEISSAYLWGNWSIHDNMTQSNSTLPSMVRLGKRNFGAFELQGLMGLNLSYNNVSIKLGYEVSDWFNQYQVFDDGTGTHTNDLIFQGLTAALNFRC